MTEGEARRVDVLTLAVGKLQGTVEAMTSQWAVQESHASAGRQIIYEKMDQLTREVGNISANVQVVTQDMAELKNDVETKISPAIESYNILTARSEGHKAGAAWAGKLFWTLIVGVAGAVGFAVHEMLLYFGHGPMGH